MHTSILLYGAPTATANNVANVQAPIRGTIEGIQVAASADLNADTENALFEISYVPSLQLSSNGAIGLLAAVHLYAGLLTSGSALCSWNGFIPLHVPVDPTQLIYLNCSLSGTNLSYFRGLVWIRGGR